MTMITWEMKEQFAFPAELGIAKEMTSVRITPQWHEHNLEDSIRLTGIYHIAANVQFDKGQPLELVEGVFIDQLDVGETDSYFEYALPLEVDLPKDKVDGSILLHVADVDSAVKDGTSVVTWQMTCSYDAPKAEPEIELEAVAEVVEEVVEEEIVFEKVPAVHEDDFYAELAEAYTVFQTNLNKIRRE